MSSRCSGFHVDLNGSLLAPTISSASPRGHGFGAASNGRIGEREGCATVEMNLLVVEVEDRFSVEDEVKLLLAARTFVVFFDQRLIRTARHEGG
jgi:hypothetical protein